MNVADLSESAEELAVENTEVQSKEYKIFLKCVEKKIVVLKLSNSARVRQYDNQ